MAQTYKFGNGTWATKKGSTLAYSDTNNAFKPLPFSFERNSIATRVNKEGSIEVVGNDIPRIDYTDSSEGALLLENSSTNLLTYSEDFSNSSWVKLGQGVGITPIVTPNYAISPDGTLNASRLQCDLNGGNTTNDRSWLYQSISTVIGDSTLSLYVKNNSNEDITFSLTNGSSQIVTILSDDKWHRLSTVKSNGGQPRIGLIGGVGASDSADLSIWGAQLEANSFSTSYIPTNGSTVQRAAETCNDSGNSEVFNDSQGVLFANIAANADDSSYKTLSLNDNSTSDRIQISINSNDIYIGVIDGGVTQVFDSVSVTDVTNFNKVVVSYKVNDCNLWVNGFKVFTDTNASMPSGLSQINFDKGDGGDDFYVKTKELGYYDTALTDEELEYLTSYRSLNEMVTELNLNAL